MPQYTSGGPQPEPVMVRGQTLADMSVEQLHLLHDQIDTELSAQAEAQGKIHHPTLLELYAVEDELELRQ